MFLRWLAGNPALHQRRLKVCKRLLLIALLTLSACLGCGRDQSGDDINGGRGSPRALGQVDLHPEKLNGRILVGSNLSLPMALGVVGPYLIVSDKTQSDSMVKVYRRQDGELTFATGRVGSGPGEFRSIWAVQNAPNGIPERPGVWVLDVNLRRLTFIDLRSSGRKTEPRHRPLVDLQAEATLTSAVWANDSTILTLGFFRKGRLGVFNKDGEQLDIVGPLPADDPSVPAQILQHAYQGLLNMKPDGTLLVVADRHAGRLELFRPTGERVAVIRGPDYFEPTFKVEQGADSAGTPVFSSGDDLRFGYVSVTSTDKEIFALFSGRIRKAFPGEANFGQFVHVFKWSGEFIRAYDLGQAVFTVVVDPTGHYLYAARHDPESAVLAFDLPTGPAGR